MTKVSLTELTRNLVHNHRTKHSCYLQDLYQTNKNTPNPSICSRITYKIRKWTTISKYHPMTKQVFRSSKKIEEERLRHINGTFWFIIHPFSMLIFVWHELFMTLIYLIVIYIDFYVCVPEIDHVMMVDSSEWCYVGLNIFYLLSQCVNFFNGYRKVRQVTNLNIATGAYQSKETEIILSPGKIAIRYLLTFFVVDFAPALSYPISIGMSDTDEEFQDLVHKLAFVRVLRILRLISVSRNLKCVISFFNLSTITGQMILRIFWLWIFLFILVFTLLTIPSIITHFYHRPPQDSPVMKKFFETYGQEETEHMTKMTIFLLLFLYTGRSILSVGDIGEVFADYQSEALVHTFMTLCELVFRIVALMSAINLISASSVSSFNYRIFRAEMNQFLVRSQVDPQLYSQVSTYLESTLRKEYFNEPEILSTLQTHMQYEIFNQTSTNFIRNCPLFYEVPDVIITNLALRLKFETCEEGEKILRVGEIGACMYFIASGTFAVYNKDKVEICHLYDADYFGEIALLEPYSKSFRTADVVALEYSHVYKLHVKDFDEVIKPGTELYNRISTIATKRVENKPDDDSSY